MREVNTHKIIRIFLASSIDDTRHPYLYMTYQIIYQRFAL